MPGDAHLRNLKRYQGMRIVVAVEALEIIANVEYWRSQIVMSNQGKFLSRSSNSRLLYMHVAVHV